MAHIILLILIIFLVVFTIYFINEFVLPTKKRSKEIDDEMFDVLLKHDKGEELHTSVWYQEYTTEDTSKPKRRFYNNFKMKQNYSKAVKRKTYKR